MMDCETEMAADGGGSPVRPNSLFHHSSNDAGDASANESSHDAPDGADDCSDERAHPPDARAEAASGAAATNEHDMMLLKKFWRTYDTIIILSIFAVLGIVFRMMSATWFRLELGSVFSEDSALGTNLPLNCWSCFLMGLLCSGRDAMGIVYSKVLGGANPYGPGRGIVDVGRGAYTGVVSAGRAGVTRARNRVRGYRNAQGVNSTASSDIAFDESSGNSDLSPSSPGLHRRRRFSSTLATPPPPPPPPLTFNNDNGNMSSPSDESVAGMLGLDEEFRIIGSHRTSEDEMREVQLRGLTRRILASPSIAFFPAKKEDTDVMEHYESDSSCPQSNPEDSDNQFEIGGLDEDIEMIEQTSPSGEATGELSRQHDPIHISSQSTTSPPDPHTTHTQRAESGSSIEAQVDEMIDTISDHYSTFRRIKVTDGWHLGTSPNEMKHIILLGLRVGFCGALSTFSSLNASVISLLRKGSIGEALVGYAISIQLGIVSYRFGQHLAVYMFVWRCRIETKRESRRGYGLRCRSDTEERPSMIVVNSGPRSSPRSRRNIVSVRTIASLLFIAILVTLCLAIYFLPKRQQYLLSLLFTPFGCLARWKLMSKYNKMLPGFPIGTFACNIGGCALSGSLGSFLAGNPGPEEGILLKSLIAGFAGSLSTFAAYIVEILSLIDPILFKFDGVVYSMITVLWAVIIGFVGSQAKNWADEI